MCLTLHFPDAVNRQQFDKSEMMAKGSDPLEGGGGESCGLSSLAGIRGGEPLPEKQASPFTPTQLIHPVKPLKPHREESRL